MNGDIKLSHSLSEQHIMQLMNLYEGESWCKERKLDDVGKMLKNSWIIALIDSSNDKLIAFGRVLSDFVYRAFVYDVIVDREYRGLGYGRLIIEGIVSHEDFKNIERIQLNCIDKNVPFYNKLGFNKAPEGTNLMRYDNSARGKSDEKKR